MSSSLVEQLLFDAFAPLDIWYSGLFVGLAGIGYGAVQLILVCSTQHSRISDCSSFFSSGQAQGINYASAHISAAESIIHLCAHLNVFDGISGFTLLSVLNENLLSCSHPNPSLNMSLLPFMSHFATNRHGV